MKNPLSRISPVSFVMLVAGLVVFGAGAVRFIERDSLDARVTYKESDKDELNMQRAPRPRLQPQLNTGDSDISVRYADRLRDASSLTLALALYVLHERVSNRHVLPNIGEVLKGLANSELMPPELNIIGANGVVASPRGLYYIRYRPNPLTIEVLAAGARGLEDGAIFLVRLPESQAVPVNDLEPRVQAGGFATLFTAPFANAAIPLPFSPAQTYRAAGWAQEPLRSAPYSAQQIADLERWLGAYNANSK